MSFEDKSRHLYIWELAGLFALCAVLLSGLWAEGRQASIAGSLVRLHVLAVSDAPEEQAVKLRVRDAVLQCLTPRLADAHDADEAGAVLASSLDLIRSAAEGAAHTTRTRRARCWLLPSISSAPLQRAQREDGRYT